MANTALCSYPSTKRAKKAPPDSGAALIVGNPELLKLRARSIPYFFLGAAAAGAAFSPGFFSF